MTGPVEPVAVLTAEPTTSPLASSAREETSFDVELAVYRRVPPPLMAIPDGPVPTATVAAKLVAPAAGGPSEATANPTAVSSTIAATTKPRRRCRGTGT